MVSESSQGIDQWLERENREKRVSRKGGSEKERERKERIRGWRQSTCLSR